MTEEFLYYVWQFKLFAGDLKSWDNQQISITKPGIKNTHAGPDFLNAQIVVNDVIWAGNVEIHTKTSDWFFHQHENDENYKKLILHVVFQHDLDEIPHDFPLIELKKFIPKQIFLNYQNLQTQKQFIPCEDLFAEVDDFTKNNFLERIFFQRLESKVQQLENRLNFLNGDWEALLFERMAYVFGLKINAESFELLAKSFPYKILQQVIRNIENVEAFLFGQAGFLDEVEDKFQQKLQTDYQFLQHKYGLKPIANHLFKFLRLRPPNFPTVRLAQLAALIKHKPLLFQEILKAENEQQILDLFQGIQPSKYWQNHFKFGKISTQKSDKFISKQLIKLLILNAIVPIRFLYAKAHGKEETEKLIALMMSIEPEQNSILKNYEKIGAKIVNAMDSQAYLELKKTFCDAKKCLHCSIGNKIIKNA